MADPFLDDSSDDDDVPAPVFKKKRQEVRIDKRRENMLQAALQHVQYRQDILVVDEQQKEAAALQEQFDEMLQRREEEAVKATQEEEAKDDWEYNQDGVLVDLDRQMRFDAVQLEACKPIASGSNKRVRVMGLVKLQGDSSSWLKKLAVPRHLWARYLQHRRELVAELVPAGLLHYVMTSECNYDVFQVVLKFVGEMSENDDVDMGISAMLLAYVDAWEIVDKDDRILEDQSGGSSRNEVMTDANAPKILMDRLLRLLATAPRPDAFFSDSHHADCLAVLATDPTLCPLVGDLLGAFPAADTLPVPTEGILGLLVALSLDPDSRYALKCAESQLLCPQNPVATLEKVRTTLLPVTSTDEAEQVLLQVRCALHVQWQTGRSAAFCDEWNRGLGQKLTKYGGRQPLLTRAHAEGQAGVLLLVELGSADQSQQATLDRFFGKRKEEVDSP